MIMKKSITLILIGLFLSTIICSETIAKETITNQEDQLLTIYMPGVTDDNYLMQKELSTNDTQTFATKINNFLILINTTISLEGPGGISVTEEEWQQISDYAKDIINSIKALDENFPDIDTEELVLKIVNSFLNPFDGFFFLHPLISVGIGFTWMPFYDYESFFGMMFRPIFTRYIYGATRVGGLFNRYFKRGTFPLYVMKFFGIFINLGDIGQEKIIGPTIFIGTAAYVRTISFFR